MNKKTNLYVGLNDKDRKKQIIKTKKAIKIINDLLINTYLLEGATIQTAKGIYKYEKGKTVIEKTIVVILLDVEEKKINMIVKDLKNILNQESILIETNPINYSFI